jgi:hypothetical protein
VREDIYRMNTIAFVDSVWRDLKYGARLLRANPGFAIVAILSLALGVGANTAIFQLLNAVRIRTLPVSRPQELAEVRIISPNEIGIRMALGADRREVTRLIMSDATVLLVAGVIVGLVLSVAAGRAAATMLFGLTATDPATLAMGAAGLGVVAMVASYLPAMRASRLEPTVALREE